MALLVTGIFYQIAMRDDGAAPDLAVVEIVVATRDLEVGSRIEATDLRLEEWPATKTPAGSFRALEDVIDRTAMHQILVREPVLERRLAEKGAGVGLSPKVPDGMRAMSVRVDDVIGVAGFVLPEARVDVLVTGMPRDNPLDGQMTKTLLGNVRVLSAGEHLTPDASGRPQKVPVVTLLLTPTQAEMVTLAQAHGRLQLVLRNSRDPEAADTTGVRESELFGSIPRTINVGNPAPVRRPAPPPPRPEPPPPPPSIEVEVIRGNQRSVQTFSPGADSGR